MAERIVVPFEGEGSGTGALSWGQAEIWRAMQRQRSWIPLITVTPLPASTTAADLAAELRFRMGRYPSMRTRYRLAGGGTPEQVLAASGETALEIIDAPDASPISAAKQAAAIRDGYLAASPDLATDWPLQMTAIRQRGMLTHLVTATCHLAVDAVGTAALLADLATLDRATGEATAPPPAPGSALSPLEQAAWQDSAAGQRVSAAAMRHWEPLLRAVPASRFPQPASPRRPRYAEASFTSRALHLACQVVAARAGTGTAPVLLAAFAVALARVTGSNPVLARVVVSNRFRPGLAESVSQVAQTGLCVVDTAGLPFGEVVRRAWRSSLAASRHAYYDPAQLDALVARLSQERGTPLDIDCFYNDRRLTGQAAAGGPADIQTALRHTTLRWEPPTGRPTERFFLHVNDVPGTVDLTASADTAHLSPGDLAACVQTMEEVTVAAALEQAADPDHQKKHIAT
jgi:hypothetical protein